MGYNFLPAERDQLYLMPPALQDWLPEGDLAWFILDTVAQMDLSAIEWTPRRSGSPLLPCARCRRAAPLTPARKAGLIGRGLL